MEVEIYTTKEKLRYVNVQKIEMVERTILVQREDEDKMYIIPLINVYQIVVDGAMHITPSDSLGYFVLGPKDETQ